MIFQTLDDKSECVGVYTEGKLHFDSIPTGLSKTWKYTGSVRDPDIEYAWLRCSGQKLQDVCPASFKEDFTELQKTFRAYLKSFQIAKIDSLISCQVTSC